MPAIQNATDLAQLAFQGYGVHGEAGPIGITRATLTEGGVSREVYVVGLSGTDYTRAFEQDGQSVGFIEAFKAGTLPAVASMYARDAEAAIQANVPAGAEIILTGHSLGGMVAQQLAADRSLKDRYEISNTVTFGSPLIGGAAREGDVQRLGATGDPVPLLSLDTIGNPIQGILGTNWEDSGYYNPLRAHGSYTEPHVFGDYDVLGVKDGDATLTYQSRDLTFHPVEPLIPRENGRLSADPSADIDALTARLEAASPEQQGALLAEAESILDRAGRRSATPEPYTVTASGTAPPQDREIGRNDVSVTPGLA